MVKSIIILVSLSTFATAVERNTENQKGGRCTQSANSVIDFKKFTDCKKTAKTPAVPAKQQETVTNMSK